MTYQPDFDHDNRRGQIGEDLVNSFLAALAESTIETKTDFRVAETGNVYIETWQWREDEAQAKPSGINTTKANFWCIASPEGNGFVMILTSALKEVIIETSPPMGKQPISSKRTMASKGRLVKMADILKKLGLGK
jgi:hypothetical protein